MYTAPSLTPGIDHLSVHLALEHAGPRPVPDRPQICLRSLFEKEAEDIIAIFSLTLERELLVLMTMMLFEARRVQTNMLG